MEDIKVAKHQLEVCFHSNLGFKEEVPRILRIIKQSSESYVQFFFKTITEVLISSQVHITPSTKFYALLTLLKASEAKNYSFYHFLVKECDLLDYIYHCAKYDLNPKSVSPNKGTHYFSKHPSPTEIILGSNFVRLCQEIIVNWNHLSKEFKPRNYFGIFKFLLGRLRKATQVKKPFFFIDKHFDLRKDLSTCNFQTQRPYIVSRQSSRNLLKVPNPAAQVTKHDDEPQINSDNSADMSMEEEFAACADELIFTSTGSYSRQSSREGGGSFLDQLRNETLKDIQKLHFNQNSENPKPAGEEEEDELIPDERETAHFKPVEHVDQVPETATTEEEEVNPPLFDLSKVGYSRYDSGDLTFALSQEDSFEKQKGEDIEQENKLNAQKPLLFRTQSVTPEKLLTFSFMGRGYSGEGKVLEDVTSRDLESDLMKIKDRITRSRMSSLSIPQTSTPEKKDCLFGFNPIKTRTELDTQSQDNLLRQQVNLGKPHVELKRLPSLQKPARPPAISIHAIRANFERSISWNFDSPLLSEGTKTGLVPQVSNISGDSEGGLTNSIHRGIRGPQRGGKGNQIIVFADQE